MVGQSRFRRAALLLAMLTLALTVGACASDSETTSAPAPSLEGIYEGKPGSNYTCAGFGGDRYALWKAGAACNDDVASASEADCVEKGSFSIDAAANTITFVDDVTGKSDTFPATFGMSNGSLTESGSLTTKNVPSGGGELVSRDSETAKPSSDQLVVAEMNVVQRGLHVLFVTCQLLLAGPNAEKLPEIARPAPITQTVGSGCSGNGGKGK